MIIKLIIGAIIGGFLGFLYQKKVGCKTGSCPITSNRTASIAYGAVIGAMFASTFS